MEADVVGDVLLEGVSDAAASQVPDHPETLEHGRLTPIYEQSGLQRHLQVNTQVSGGVCVCACV